ncbi:hypothetical protein [Bradyrhizobium sp. STM 3562]|uniref:hypothetical protein n=1 Tax=Bradyrhizobium sp. STM 3562 TaxID=578924 RepID=UPI00388DDAA5
MAGFKLFGAAVLFSALFATQAFAQAAVQEPGAFAFYHPNADVLNAGRSAPRDALAFYPPRPDIGGSRLEVRPHRMHHRPFGRAY